MTYLLDSAVFKGEPYPLVEFCGFDPEIIRASELAQLLLYGKSIQPTVSGLPEIPSVSSVELPRRLILKKQPPGQLPDVLFPSHGLVISHKLKNIIEDFEPSTHRFHEMEIVSGPKGRVLCSAFLMISTNSIDAIVHDETYYNWFDNDSGKPMAGSMAAIKSNGTFYRIRARDSSQHEGSPIISLDSSAISGKHFWRGTLGSRLECYKKYTGGDGNSIYIDLLASTFFCSDVFANELITSGIVGWSPTKILEELPSNIQERPSFE